MFPGVNRRQAEQLMKQMGIKSEDIAAEEVIIKTRDKNIIITNPQVSKINMLGKDTFQVMGDVKEGPKEIDVAEEDIKTVMEHVMVSKDKAREALENTGGDIARAIMELQK